MLPRARAARRETLSERVSRCSRGSRSGAPGRRHAVGRRAADAGDRPLPDGPPELDHVRRAFARPRARWSCTTSSHHPPPQPSTASPSSSSSRTSPSRSSLASAGYVLENGRIVHDRHGQGVARRRPRAAGVCGVVTRGHHDRAWQRIFIFCGAEVRSMDLHLHGDRSISFFIRNSIGSPMPLRPNVR